MPSTAELRKYHAANRAVVGQAVAALAAVWESLDWSDPVKARRALERVYPSLVREYGAPAAALAADFFELSRYQAGVPGRARAVLADEVSSRVANARMRSVIAPAFAGDPGRALSALEVLTDELVLSRGRETIHASAEADPRRPRVARVPTGAETCAFCLMLASRGPVYRDEDTAMGQSEDHYHGDCDCEPVVVYTNRDLPEHYDHEKLYQDLYLPARDAAFPDGGPFEQHAILSKMREQNDWITH